MSKKFKIYSLLFLLFLLAVVYYENSKPKPINWFPSYAKKDKIPYGTYVLRNELASVLKTKNIKNVTIPPYVFLKDSTKNGTYIFIDNAINFGKEEFNKMLKFVHRGNDVFISTHGINIDTLHLKTEQILTNNFNEKPFFKLLNKNLKLPEFSFDRKFLNIFFTKLDTLNTVALGKAGYLNEANQRTEEGLNFIKYAYGKGNFYFHTFPEAFTNYYILKNNNRQYTEGLLSYIKTDKPIFWDSYYKTGKSRITSPMIYLLNNPSLKWAYYVILIGVLFFVLFEGKRKQRFIKVITPLKNQTLAFTRTIANMYYQKSEHKNIALHKIEYLLDYIRTKLRIPTNQINTVFYKDVAARSGNDIEEVEKLFSFCNKIQDKKSVTKEDVLKLNKLMEEFKHSTNK